MNTYNIPLPGSIWNGQGFQIEVIDKNDKENIGKDGNYIRSGRVVYKYLTEPVGKIGNCKTLEGFYASWKKAAN